MTDRDLEAYRKAEPPVPKTMRRWHLYGAGFENLGRAGEPEEVEVPAYGSDELLVRQDACGLCFSDTKVIALGPGHPRMTGRDLSKDPVTLGHEVACTIVGVGENLQGRFAVGDRFVIQADVFYQGKSMAYGYAIRGGLAQYSVIPKAIIEGDEGCYLLPIRPDTGYVEAALVEPWACVVSAYAQTHRDGIRHGGRMLVIGSDEAAGRSYDWRDLFAPNRKPERALVWRLHGAAFESLAAQAGERGFPLEPVEGEDWAAIKAERTEGRGFDDILILGSVRPETIEGAATSLADHGILNLVCDRPVPRKLSLDIGRIHYNWHHYLGTTTDRPADAYREVRSADLQPGGIAWFIGAGGPMGQMHVQRAVQNRQPPRRIVATDIDATRLASVVERFSRQAAERGVELIALNPNTLGEEAFLHTLRKLGEKHGFDDIVSLVPVPGVIEQAADFLAEGGWFNIFAGVARGMMAQLNINKVVRGRSRFLGSSGSSLADMRETLARVEKDELSTNASLAAIGGMDAAAEGLLAVKEGRFPGKTLIFPQIPHLPLTALSELKEQFPTVYERLKDGQFWTQEAEEELLRLAVANEAVA
ncbi:MAG TPA: alcohol dehydrogenase catalytic domain-containing protein [Chthonomonadaceae bacterium]|nr:alcohol dehydrogenase catalytic domain-containing protein [Chthonomonadaceae bacterium]